MDDNIIPAPGQSIAEQMMMKYDLDNRLVSAITSLRRGKIPESMISKHPGKGNQVFRYVKHTHATQVLVDAFPALLFDWTILNWEVFPDKTAVVRGKLDVKFQDKHGEWIVLSVTEVGIFEDLSKSKEMPYAMLVASAASRALPRAMMRMFGWGIELYPDAVTKEESWWNAVKSLAASRKPPVPEDVVVKWNKEHGITGETLQDHYEEVCQFVMSYKPPEE